MTHQIKLHQGAWIDTLADGTQTTPCDAGDGARRLEARGYVLVRTGRGVEGRSVTVWERRPKHIDRYRAGG